MRLQKISSCLLAAGLAAATAAAQADVTFETRLSNVAFSVTDLAPDDGVTAGYDYSVSSVVNWLGLYGPVEQKEIRDDEAGIGPLYHELNTGNSHVSISASGVPGDFSLQGAILDNLGDRGGGVAAIDQRYTFTLTANSALNLSAHLFMHISPSSTPYQQGWANATFRFWSPDIALGINKNEHLHSPTDGGEVIDQDYSFTYANTTNQDITVNLSLWATTTSLIYLPAPVPEPSTYAMLGLGLLTVAAARHRRRPTV